MILNSQKFAASKDDINIWINRISNDATYLWIEHSASRLMTEVDFSLALSQVS